MQLSVACCSCAERHLDRMFSQSIGFDDIAGFSLNFRSFPPRYLAPIATVFLLVLARRRTTMSSHSTPSTAMVQIGGCMQQAVREVTW